MHKKYSFKVRNSVFSMDQSLYDYVKELECREFNTTEESLLLEKFRTLTELYEDTVRPQYATDVVSYVVSHPDVQMDVVFEIDRPGSHNLVSVNRDGRDIKAKFEIDVFDEGSDNNGIIPFINWYINNFSSLIKYMICRKEKVKVLQPREENFKWEIRGSRLFLDLDYQIVFE